MKWKSATLYRDAVGFVFLEERLQVVAEARSPVTDTLFMRRSVALRWGKGSGLSLQVAGYSSAMAFAAKKCFSAGEYSVSIHGYGYKGARVQYSSDLVWIFRSQRFR